MQWTSHFLEVAIVASCNECLSLPKKKTKSVMPCSVPSHACRACNGSCLSSEDSSDCCLDKTVGSCLNMPVRLSAEQKLTMMLSACLPCAEVCYFLFLFFWVTGELSILRQMMAVPNEPGLCPNTGLENAFLSDQFMASNPCKGLAKRIGAKTTSPDGKAGHVMTHVCHRVRHTCAMQCSTANCFVQGWHA